MQCINCGANIPDGSKFCPKCGTKIEYDEKLNEQAEEPENPQQDEAAEPTRKFETTEPADTAQQSKPDDPISDYLEKNLPADSDSEAGRRISGKVIGIIVAAVFVVAAVVVVLILTVGGASTLTIDLDQYVDITFSGDNGEGTASYKFDSESLIADYSGKISWNEDDSDAALLKLIYSDPVQALADALYGKGSVSPNSGLSNGDTVTFNWNASVGDNEKSINAKLEYSGFEEEVSGLEEPVAESSEPTASAKPEESMDKTKESEEVTASEEAISETPQPSETGNTEGEGQEPDQKVSDEQPSAETPAPSAVTMPPDDIVLNFANLIIPTWGVDAEAYNSGQIYFDTNQAVEFATLMAYWDGKLDPSWVEHFDSDYLDSNYVVYYIPVSTVETYMTRLFGNRYQLSDFSNTEKHSTFVKSIPNYADSLGEYVLRNADGDFELYFYIGSYGLTADNFSVNSISLSEDNTWLAVVGFTCSEMGATSSKTMGFSLVEDPSAEYGWAITAISLN